jgi:Domain of unknown function (DUF4157)
MSRCKSEIRRSKLPVFQIALGISLSAFAQAPTAFACGGIFDVACNLNHGGMSPDNIAKQAGKAAQDAANAVAKAGQDVANAINELQAGGLTGPALEQAIIASHNTAINGAIPIPPQIRQQLTGYSSEDSMNRVRYKIGDNGFANLAHLLEQGGAASAVTLIDVVVFRGPSEAADLSTWAHELTHVDQYRDWGVHSFAVQYVRNWHSVEDPAYAKGNGYQAWAANTGNGNGQSQPAGLPSGFGMTACGCWGPSPPATAQEPRCNSGAVTINICQGFCAPGNPAYHYVCM